MIARRLGWCATIVFAVLALASAATSQQPSASLSGRVVTDDENGRPVRAAIVAVKSSALPQPLSVVTNDDGTFVCDGLPADQYVVTAAKNGYLTTAFGSKRPGRPGIPIKIDRDEHKSGITVRLSRAGVISGTLKYESGAPVQGANVWAAVGDSGDNQFPAGALSDDQGAYRISGLAPGDYVVMATASYALYGLGSVSASTRSTEEVDRILALLQQGIRRPAPAGATAASPPPRNTVAYAPIFFPGTPFADEAVPVSVGLGEERQGIDVTVRLLPMARLEGAVLSPSGQPAPGVKLSLTRGGSPIPIRWPTFQGTVESDRDQGRFSFAALDPGLYRLTARASIFHPISDEHTGEWLLSFESEDLRLGPGETRQLTLQLRGGATLDGRVIVDASSPSPALDLNTVRIDLVPPAAFTDPRDLSSWIEPTGKFGIESIPAGSYRLALTLLPRPWSIRSALLNGVDVTDVPIDLASETRQSLVVTLTDRHADLEGQLQVGSGAAASDYFVIVFPSERALWHNGSRRVAVLRPSTSGGFSTGDLPAGDYLLAALTDVVPNEWNDPAFLASLTANAVPVTLREGERRSLTVRIASLSGR